MIDILERIDKHLINDDAEHRHWHADGLLEDAAMEIERLRSTVMELCVKSGKLEDERDDLLKEIREMNGRIDNLQWRGRWLPKPKQE